MAKTKTKPNPAHYIDNKLFFIQVKDYVDDCNAAFAIGEKRPIIPDVIAISFMKIARKLANRPNFIGYTWKEEMILDGIENCIRYVHKFDHNKSNNPFAYYSQICYFAFLRRIAQENKQTDTKSKLYDTQLDNSTFYHLDKQDSGDMKFHESHAPLDHYSDRNTD
jgi:hypothetical protein